MTCLLARSLFAVVVIAASACVRTADIVALPPVPDAHGFAGAFAGVHNGQLLAGGGANFPDGRMPWDGGTKVWHDHVFALALGTPGASWRAIGRLPQANAYGVSLTIPDGVLLIGGGNAARNFTDVVLMTQRGEAISFRALPSLPAPLAQLAGALVGRAVHVVGGIERPDATSASARHYRLRLDSIEKGWDELPALPAPGRILATAAAIGDAFFVLGGCALAADSAGKPMRTYLRDAWKFSAGRWTRLPDMPRASAAAASPAPTTDGSLFVISGDDGTQTGLASPVQHRGFSSDILRYDPLTNSWHHAGTLGAPAPVTLPTAPWEDGFVLFNGEVRPGVRTPQVFLFRPAP